MPAPDGRALAVLLATKAHGDEIVLARLLGDAEVPDAVLGFHAQQAVEKLLKAALATVGAVPPRTHDIARLNDLVVSAGLEPPEAARDARRLAPWAVEMRYDDFLGEGLDREWARRVVADVRTWLDAILARADRG